MRMKWNDYLAKKPRIIIFDTETTGLSKDDNDILSISWQIVDTKNWEVSSSGNIYFQWPEEIERVSIKAIEINKLTKERLEELGTIDQKEGINMFAEAVANSDLVVGHNVTFDMEFVDATIKRLGMNPIKWPTVFDTMKSMWKYCRKRPKLVELVHTLNIDDSDIDYHQSASDVEVTKRCFKTIASNELTTPTNL